MKSQSVKRVPHLWVRLSVLQGNTIQLAGLLIGMGLLGVAARLAGPGATRIALMVGGWFIIYDTCHALAHWAVGRAVGIRFRGYGLRGTDHPEIYPPGIRQLMSVMPFFTALTVKTSMQGASARAKAAMFAAGETSTTICALLAAGYAAAHGIPGGYVLFIFALVLTLSSTVVTALTPRGDYAKAIKALRGR
jgi:hypothetical protein